MYFVSGVKGSLQIQSGDTLDSEASSMGKFVVETREPTLKVLNKYYKAKGLWEIVNPTLTVASE